MACPYGGCDKPKRAKGWCSSCYNRARRYGDPKHQPRRGRPPERVGCTTPGCERKHWGRGKCQRCYMAAYRRGEFLPDTQETA